MNRLLFHALAWSARLDQTKYRYKWVRTHIRGETDPNNVLRHEHAGWKVVKPWQVPDDLKPVRTPDERWSRTDLLNPNERVEHDGLKLYRVPEVDAVEREDWLRSHPVPNADFYVYFEHNTIDYAGTVNKGSLRDQINEYYSEANRQAYPERQAEYEASEENLRRKGLSFN